MNVVDRLGSRRGGGRGDLFWLSLAMGGVALAAWAITLMFLLTRSVLDVGGRCAVGGAFEIRVECPDAVSLLMPGSIVVGMVGVWLMVVGSLTFPGPHLWPLAWPALFGTQAWLGVEFGVFRNGFRSGPLLLGLLFAALAFFPARALVRRPESRRSLIADPGPRTAPAWATIRRMQALTMMAIVIGVAMAWLVFDAAVPGVSSV